MGSKKVRFTDSSNETFDKRAKLTTAGRMWTWRTPKKPDRSTVFRKLAITNSIVQRRAIPQREQMLVNKITLRPQMEKRRESKVPAKRKKRRQILHPSKSLVALQRFQTRHEANLERLRKEIRKRGVSLAENLLNLQKLEETLTRKYEKIRKMNISMDAKELQKKRDNLMISIENLLQNLWIMQGEGENLLRKRRSRKRL